MPRTATPVAPDAETAAAVVQVAALEDIPAGPALAAALADIDVDRVPGPSLPFLLQARCRQANHERGALVATVVAILRYNVPAPVAELSAKPGEFAVDEVRAALRLTRKGAKILCELAWDLPRRLPDVLAAMLSGVLDQGRAQVFSTWTADLSREHVDDVVAQVLPLAPELTTGELKGAIARLAIALDPEWTRRRYEAALRGRRVVGKPNPDGTGTLTGHDLPAGEVLAACARLDALARAATAAGHPDRLDHLRADLLLAMLTGRYTGMTDQQIIADLLATTTAPTKTATDADEEGPIPDDPTADDEPAAAGRSVIGRRGGLRLAAGLPSVAGFDHRPGELLGWGPVHAPLARHIASQIGSWWCVLVEEDGTPQTIVPIRRRPVPPCGGPPGPRFPGEVWLYTTRERLRLLTEAARVGLLHAGWAPVLAEITTSLDTARPGPPNGDPTARLPGNALRRWVHLRDGQCTFPGCRAPAHRADADHTTEHAKGGQTVDSGLAAACRHDHRLRHEGGWTVSHPAPGQVTWTSPLGHSYRRHKRPGLLDLPEPRANALAEDDPEPPPSDPPPWADPKSCYQHPPEPEPAPPIRTRRLSDDLPPF
jgi:hypothetical protein